MVIDCILLKHLLTINIFKKKKEQFKAIAINKKENFDYTINAMLVILGHMY